MAILLFKQKNRQHFFQKWANNSYLSCSQVGSYQTFYYPFVRNADEGARFSKIIVSSDEELKLLTSPRSTAKLHSVLNHLLSSNENWLSAITTIEEIAKHTGLRWHSRESWEIIVHSMLGHSWGIPGHYS